MQSNAMEGAAQVQYCARLNRVYNVVNYTAYVYTRESSLNLNSTRWSLLARSIRPATCVMAQRYSSATLV